MTVYCYTTKPECPTLFGIAAAGARVVPIQQAGPVAIMPSPGDVAYFRAAYETQLDSPLTIAAVALADAVVLGGGEGRVRVVNHPRHIAAAQVKWCAYSMLKAAGFSVPAYIVQPTYAEAVISCEHCWPVIVRQADGSTGRNMRICHNRAMLMAAIQAMQDARLRYMLVSYVDTRLEGTTKFHRRRAWIIGDKVDHHNVLTSSQWIISDVGRRLRNPDLPPEAEHQLTMIGRVLGLESYSVDFVCGTGHDSDTPKIMVFDVNPTYWYVPAKDDGHLVRLVEWLRSKEIPA